MTANRPIPNSFYRALNLRERSEILAASPHALKVSSAADRASDPNDDSQRAQLRSARHRALPGFSEPFAYDDRLSELGLTADQAAGLFAASDSWLAQHCPAPPSWARLICDSYDGPEGLTLHGTTLAAAATPLIQYAERAITAEAKRLSVAHEHLPFEVDTVAKALLSQLSGELQSMLERTLVLEMHVAMLLGQLAGQDSQARYASFLTRLSQPGVMMQLFDEYPVLARVIGCHVEQTIAAANQMLVRLTLDFSTLVSALGFPADPGALLLALAAGDRHDGGERVMLLRWACGAELAYKPKPLAADVRFQDLVEWLNEHGATPPLESLPTLDMGDYGYSVVVRPESCQSDAELAQFFERQGALLAVLYGLLATDFHCENVIAMGAHPYPIDLESLFHAQISASSTIGADAQSEADLVYSVLRVGLLPERANDNSAAADIDLSGLGGQRGQLSPLPQPTWEGAGTDAMRLVRRRLPLAGSANQPTLLGATVHAFDYTEQLTAGFSRMYRLIEQHRQDWLADGGILDQFADDVVRVIARPTRVYAALLGESYHPDLLRNAIDRDIHFDRLWSFDAERRHFVKLVRWEQHDLWRGDIPKFTVRVSGRTLHHHSGSLPDFFAQSGLSLARRQLGRFGQRDLAHQRWIVQASMVSLATDVRAGRWARYEPNLDTPHYDQQELVAMADKLASRLADTALTAAGEATWLGLAFMGQSWVLAPLGTDLYGGLLGVALFLAHAAAITQSQRYFDLAEAAMKTLLRKERAAAHLEQAIGGYSGLGATVYGLAHIGTLWDRDDLLELARDRMVAIESRIESDESLDVLSGSSGAAAALIAYHRLSGDKQALVLAEACAERICARAQPMKEGVGWPCAETEGRALAGFSHGAGGIAWALLQVYEASGNLRYRHVAQQAIDYERTLFVPDEGNYYDLRPELLAGPNAQFSMAWCHGAPGVGLARASQLHLLDERARAEVRLTAEATLRSLGRGHSLCHGDLGNLELVMRAAQVLNDPSLRSRAGHGVNAALAQARAHGWLCGVPLAVETPGLMVGLAGMGYQLLRFARPEQVPSVLLLETPVLARARSEYAA